MIIRFNQDTVDGKDKQSIATIIQEAFWEKLKWFFAKVSKEEAIELLMKAITYNLGFYYKEGDQVLGAAILSEAEIHHFRVGVNIKKRIGFLRGFLLELMFGMKPKKNNLCLQMFAVVPDARGKGIGKRLLLHLYRFAEEKAYRAITLDVIDSNEKAKKLYEREGFVVTRYLKTKLFTEKMGFNGVYTMTKEHKTTLQC